MQSARVVQRLAGIRPRAHRLARLEWLQYSYGCQCPAPTCMQNTICHPPPLPQVFSKVGFTPAALQDLHTQVSLGVGLLVPLVLLILMGITWLEGLAPDTPGERPVWLTGVDWGWTEDT